jgi:hypothetical protein
MKTTLAVATALAVLATSPAFAQNVSLAPTYGTRNISAGFQPDPLNIAVVSGGSIDASSSIGNGCGGYVAAAPDFRLNYSAGTLPLIISVNAASDTTLVINGPNGNWICDDDGGNQGLNPAITLRGAPSGQYDIWVGAYQAGNNTQATLSISELSSY